MWLFQSTCCAAQADSCEGGKQQEAPLNQHASVRWDDESFEFERSEDFSAPKNTMILDRAMTPRTLHDVEESFDSLTPRQKRFHNKVKLPDRLLDECNIPESAVLPKEGTREEKLDELNKIYKKFVLSLNRGIVLKQVITTRSYADIHCQLMDDMINLTINQGSGVLVLISLDSVSGLDFYVQRPSIYAEAATVTRNTSSTNPLVPSLRLNSADYLVIMKFAVDGYKERKIVFVFHNERKGTTFKLCMELLVEQTKRFSNKKYSRRNLELLVAGTLRVC